MSAAAGASLGTPWAVVDAVAAIAATGVDYVKVGFSPDKSGADCVRALGPHASNTKLVGVLFADCAPDLDMLALMANNGFSGAMLDTAKRMGRLLIIWMSPRSIADRPVAGERLTSGLAGSLEAPGVPRLPLEPGIPVSSGGICQGQARGAAIDAASASR